MDTKKILLPLLLLVAASGSVFAQSRGNINGRVTDPGGAVIAGAVVTATNTGTGLARNTVSNAEGLYNFPALEPGSYDIKVETKGFATSVKAGVTLITDTTIALDFGMAVASATQEVEVTGEQAMVETTQSEVSGTLQTSEVSNLPMLNRNFTGLVELLPGARPAPSYNPTKAAMGAAIAVGGGIGRNVEVDVDGMPNRDDLIGGPLQNYTIEGIEEFKLLDHDYGAQYKGSNGAVLEIATKSGTNSVHGSAFGYGRNDALTAIDYFTQVSNLPKTSYNREQFGGSIGGPIKKNRLFVFGAVERIQQDYIQTEAPAAYNEAVLLAQALPSFGFVPAATIPQPYRDNMYTVKADFHINSKHSLFARWAQQINSQANDVITSTHADLSLPSHDNNHFYSIVASETWLIGSNSLNQFSFQRNDYSDDIASNGDDVSPGYFFSSRPAYENVSFPSVGLGKITSGGAATYGADQRFLQKKWQFEDNFSHLFGKHALKFGGDFAFYPEMTIIANIGTCGNVVFFDNPDTILHNTNGKYPKGFLTPGIVSTISVGTCSSGGFPINPATLGQKQAGGYVQDDWKVKPHLTLNLGLRYDVDINALNQTENPNNRANLVLQAIHSPFGALPHTSTRDFAPRVGLAWDIGGHGKNVLRAGFGIFFDEVLYSNATDRLVGPTLLLSASFVNTAVGVGQLANYVYGVSPLPAGPPPIATQLPAGGNTGGAIFDPAITVPYNEQTHIGYTRELTANTTLSADYTHVLGLREGRSQMINPIENAWDPTDADHHIPFGTRRLAPAFAAIGETNILGAITAENSVDRSQFNELIVHLEHRYSRVTFQASYILASAYGFGGGSAGDAQGLNNTPGPENQDLQFGPGEWGPTQTDERHRIVLSGVFNLPYGIQVSPIFQAASARPYLLTAGSDCNGDGVNNDRAFMNPSTGAVWSGCNPPAGYAQVSVNSQRGDPSWDWDTRVSKFFKLGNETRKIGFFAEFYNITNRVNFGNNYQGNSLAANFRQPIAYLAGFPSSRQLQLGARFTF